MPLIDVVGGQDGGYWLWQQFVDFLKGKNDIGSWSAFAQISAPGAPTATVSTTAGSLTGPYQYCVAYVTGYWEGVAGSGTLLTQGNTEAGTASATVNPNAQEVDLSNIAIGPSGTMARLIGRTKSGGSEFYVLTQINDNTTTTLTDDAVDSTLTQLMPATNTTGSAASLWQLMISDTLTINGPVAGSTLNAADGIPQLDSTAKIPVDLLANLLATANTWTQAQTVNGAMAATSFSGDGSALTNITASQVGAVASSEVGAASGVAPLDSNEQVPAVNLKNADGIPYVVDTGTTNALVATLSPAPTAYADGLVLCVKVADTTTGAATLDVNGLGTIDLYNSDGTAVGSGDLVGGTPVTFRYVGGSFFVLGGSGGLSSSGTATTADVLSPYTFTSESGRTQTGAMQNLGALSYDPSTATQTSSAGYTSGVTVNPVTGTATTADVLPSATFSSGTGIDQTGAMQTVAGGNTITPTQNNQTAIAGSTYAENAITVAGSSNLTQANIANGVDIFNVTGTYTGYATGTATYNGSLTVSGLAFQPSRVIVIEIDTTGTASHFAFDSAQGDYINDGSNGGYGFSAVTYAAASGGFSLSNGPGGTFSIYWIALR